MLFLDLFGLALELGVQGLALLNGQLALLDQIVNDFLTLLHRGGQGADARQKHLAQAFTEIEISHRVLL